MEGFNLFTAVTVNQNIVHFLFSRGLEWDTQIGGRTGVTVKYLIEELYYKVC